MLFQLFLIYTIFLIHKFIIDAAILLDENMKKEIQQEIYGETNSR